MMCLKTGAPPNPLVNHVPKLSTITIAITGVHVQTHPNFKMYDIEKTTHGFGYVDDLNQFQVTWRVQVLIVFGPGKQTDHGNDKVDLDVAATIPTDSQAEFVHALI